MRSDSLLQPRTEKSTEPSTASKPLIAAQGVPRLDGPSELFTLRPAQVIFLESMQLTASSAASGSDMSDIPVATTTC